jgi:hypothetical protein
VSPATGQWIDEKGPLEEIREIEETRAERMSSRAVRKALKRLEAQKQLEQQPPKDDPAEDQVEDDEDEIETPANPFAMVISCNFHI